MPDYSTTIETALGGLDTELLAVGAAGLVVTAVVWGFPLAVRFFKKIAR